MIQQHIPMGLAKVGDVINFAAAVSVVAGWLPVAVGFATLLWTILRIYEMDTTQRLISCCTTGTCAACSWVRSKFRKGE